MNTYEEPNHELNKELVCQGCGSILKFVPSKDSLNCEYCGFTNKIKIDDHLTVEATQELDYYNALHQGLSQAEKHEFVTVTCRSCGAQSILNSNVISDECSCCGTPLVVKEATRSSVIKPKAILPFKIDSWFAPNKFKKYAKINEILKGVYIPYWTYDNHSYTRYSGERGVDYTVSEQ